MNSKAYFLRQRSQLIARTTELNLMEIRPVKIGNNAYSFMLARKRIESSVMAP